MAAPTASAYDSAIGSKKAPGRPSITATGAIASRAMSDPYASGARISCVASRMRDAADRDAPLAPFARFAPCGRRSRLPTFSALTTASSITIATAAARPANEIALKVSPRRSSTSAAAASETGIVASAIATVRHWNRNATSTRTRRAPAIAIVSVEVVDGVLDQARRPEA